MSARLDAIGVIVSDLPRAVDLYRRLGLEFPDAAEGHVEASNAPIRFMLDTEDVIRSFDPNWKRPDGHSVALAFRCDSAQDVDRVHAELVDAGASSYREPWDAFWGQRYAQLRDPDGNPIDLFADL